MKTMRPFACRLSSVLLIAVLAGCASHAPAPVEERGGPVPAPVPAPGVAAGAAPPSSVGAGLYVVKKGDTLYSIALDHGHDYRDLAGWNNIENPNLIRIGQTLRVAPPEGGAPVAVVKPVTSSGPVEVRPTPAGANTETLKREPRGGKEPYSDDALAKAREGEAVRSPEPVPEPKPAEARPADPKPAEKAPEKPVAGGDELEWLWPAAGKVTAAFVDGGAKGIDIAAKAGDPVQAAAAGVVSYAGSGLRGYGNLVVVRHNATYLSVYAHNSRILVKEKQAVAKGQKIAEVGSTDTDSPRLHFEIRRQGKPVDPQKLLPPR